MWSGPCPTPSTWHHLDLQDLPLKTNALLPAIVLRMNLDIFSFLKVSHKDTCLPHNIFSHELWVEMTAQAKLCPAIAALKTSGFWLGFEKNWIFLEVGDHDLNVDQGDEDVEAVRGQYRRVVFEKLILMTIYWWWWWCWPMKVYKECRWRQQLWRYCLTCCVEP